MTRRLLLAAVAVSLAVAAPAHAKGVIKATACGADGCRAIATRAHDTSLLEMGAEADGPTASGPGFVRLHITIGEDGDPAHGVKLTQLYVPARDLLAVHEDSGGWVWTTPLPAGSKALKRAVRGLRPIPARRLPAAARRTAPAPEARVVETVTAPAADTRTAGAGNSIPAWAWPLLALVILVAAFAARRHRRA